MANKAATFMELARLLSELPNNRELATRVAEEMTGQTGITARTAALVFARCAESLISTELPSDVSPEVIGAAVEELLARFGGESAIQDFSRGRDRARANRRRLAREASVRRTGT